MEKFNKINDLQAEHILYGSVNLFEWEDSERKQRK